MFSKILIANRGEVAVRIIRSCKEMGISTVAVYSQVDAEALHVALADQSFCIGKADAADSYLNQDRILSAALVSGAQAIHPGYGFLSENAEFAARCLKNGIAFIGPSVESMRRLSDKERIKTLMAEAGLPVIPGSQVLSSVREARQAAENMGYPVMIKARSGGGGRGIRLVTRPEELEQSYHSAVAEARAAFGDGAVYMEKYVHPAKHIEMQIIADEDGHVVCLGERDCSVQRNHQKLIEESPCTVLTKTQRGTLMEQVAKAVRTVGYSGIGTLEFLLDRQSGQAYFMEMNVRLQVEHPVTEMLTGIDLVKWQIRVAAGVPLSFTQADVRMESASIECRINALRPGKVTFLHVPGGPNVRFDTFMITGCEISPYYDAMIGKLIVNAVTREEALRKMQASLCELVIQGVDNNIEEQIDLITRKEFVNGTYDLDFLK